MQPLEAFLRSVSQVGLRYDIVLQTAFAGCLVFFNPGKDAARSRERRPAQAGILGLFAPATESSPALILRAATPAELTTREKKPTVPSYRLRSGRSAEIGRRVGVGRRRVYGLLCRPRFHPPINSCVKLDLIGSGGHPRRNSIAHRRHIQIGLDQAFYSESLRCACRVYPAANWTSLDAAAIA